MNDYPGQHPNYETIKATHVFVGVALASGLCFAAVREMLKYPNVC